MRVVIADDSLLLREGLARLLGEVGFDTVACVGDVVGLLAAVAAHSPDLAVVDVRLPPTFTTEGLVAAEKLRESRPGLGVLLLSQFVETQYALRLLETRGAGIGYLLKDRVSDLAEFAAALRHVALGGSAVDPEVVAQLMHAARARAQIERLSEREREVLVLMAQGASNQAICDRLSLGPKTVETHVHNIFAKLELEVAPDAHRRVRAVLRYLDAV